MKMHRKMSNDPLVYGREAYENKGFQENMRHMESEGYGKQRAIGTAYGEADKALRKASGQNDMCKKRLSGNMGR